MNTELTFTGTPHSRISAESIFDSAPSITACYLGLVLVALQVLDGVLTAEGVHRYGVGMEGNLLLRSLMHTMGPVGALLAAKCGACLVIMILVLLTRSVPWLEGALKLVSGIYIFAAVLPWTLILLGQL